MSERNVNGAMLRVKQAFRDGIRTPARRAFWLGLALSLAGTGTLKAQITTISQGSQLPSPQVVGSMADPNSGPHDSDPAMQQQRLQAMKMLRQSELASDTRKLLKLTAQLNVEIEQNHARALTHQQLRMAAKIEKLAKSIRKNMSTPISGMTMDPAISPGSS